MESKKEIFERFWLVFGYWEKIFAYRPQSAKVDMLAGQIKHAHGEFNMLIVQSGIVTQASHSSSQSQLKPNTATAPAGRNFCRKPHSLILF